MWTLAKVLNGFADLQNERFHTFAIKKDGVVVGELKFASRPKNAGGPAWRGTKFNDPKHYGMNVVYFSHDKKNVLNWFKTGEVK
jgi:hypothetical protein